MANTSGQSPPRQGEHYLTFTFKPRSEIETRAHSASPEAPITRFIKHLFGLAPRLRPPVSTDAVINAELAAIQRRRNHVRDLPRNTEICTPGDRTQSELTGVALSGGGIRSASVCLGALQGLNVAVCKDGFEHSREAINGVDFLSTVSGGGYTGCALTNSMSLRGGVFPFIDRSTHADTAAVAHIRDFSNYLIPRGGRDIITAVGVILRGLVANALIILPFFLLFVWLTLRSHPRFESLAQPTILGLNLQDELAAISLPTSSMSGFWFTVVILLVDLFFLMIWVVIKSGCSQRHVPHHWQMGSDGELSGVFAGIARLLFFVTILVFVLELQPFILSYALRPGPPYPYPCVRALVLGEYGLCTSTWLFKLPEVSPPLLTLLGSVIALFSKYLGDVAASAKPNRGVTGWLKRIAAKAAIWFSAVIVPLSLWNLYLFVAARSIDHPDGFLFLDCVAPSWLWWAGETNAARLCFIAFAVAVLIAIFVNPNVTSLFRLYRDRLSKAFIFDPIRRDTDNDLAAVQPKLHEINTTFCPYPIINAALNIEGSPYANKRGRNADFFVFTPEYVGSDATGYVGSALIETEEAELNLGSAMAISGAAISSNMGALTIRPLTLTLALLNVRLGCWLLNPLWITGRRRRCKPVDPRNYFLLREMFSRLSELDTYVYLTDGGNIENLGIYSLLKRRCPVIIAVDAEEDPAMGFGSFLTLERYARIDLGVTIDLPWQAIRDRTLAVDKIFEDGKEDTLDAMGPHCAAGEIDFGDGGGKGVLLYVKASLTGDEEDYVLDYKRRYPDFPHETTGDQFFGEEQLEAYRALGFHMMQRVLSGKAPLAVKPGPEETEQQARERILGRIRTAILGN